MTDSALLRGDRQIEHQLPHEAYGNGAVADDQVIVLLRVEATTPSPLRLAAELGPIIGQCWPIEQLP